MIETDYLSSLEIREVGDRPNIIVTVIFVFFIFILLVLAGILGAVGVTFSLNYLHNGKSLDLVAIAQLLLPASIFATSVGVIHKLFFYPVFWRADAEGITVRSTIHTRRVSWSEIRNAESKRSKLSGKQIILEVDRRRVKIQSVAMRDPLFEASLFQHLKKNNVRSNIRLSADAKSLYTPIPESVPYEMDWEAGSSDRTTQPGLKIELRPGSISSEGYGEKATILWKDVWIVQWQPDALVVKGKSDLSAHDEIQIPIIESDAESVKLVLAAIRQLRAVGQAVIMPEVLRRAARGVLES